MESLFIITIAIVPISRITLMQTSRVSRFLRSAPATREIIEDLYFDYYQVQLFDFLSGSLPQSHFLAE